MYIQTSFVRRTPRSEIQLVSKSSVWVKKFGDKLPSRKKERNLIAIDETVAKANRKRYYVCVKWTRLLLKSKDF